MTELPDRSSRFRLPEVSVRLQSRHENNSTRLRQASLRRCDGYECISTSSDVSVAYFLFDSGLSRLEPGQDTGFCGATRLCSHRIAWAGRESRSAFPRGFFCAKPCADKTCHCIPWPEC